MAEYLYYMTKYNIPTIFLDFDSMVTNKKYLYDNLQDIFDKSNITFDNFSQAYDIASQTSKPKNNK